MAEFEGDHSRWMLGAGCQEGRRGKMLVSLPALLELESKFPPGSGH